MKGRKQHHGGHKAHHAGHKAHHAGHKAHHAGHKAHGGPVVNETESHVYKEAGGGKDIGKIGGMKGKTRLDRKRGGACHAAGGHAHHDGMPKVHHGHGGVAKHHSLAGGHHHATGGKAGADETPYSSAGRQLRAHKSGGHAHHGH